jgi:hypothetical protein
MDLFEEIGLLQTGINEDTIQMNSVKTEGGKTVDMHVVTYC